LIPKKSPKFVVTRRPATCSGSPGAVKDGWDGILKLQLDVRHRPCNFVEIMPRLDEHLRRAKAKGATV
jgi:molybdenum cofactor biosynthesis protein B